MTRFAIIGAAVLSASAAAGRQEADVAQASRRAPLMLDLSGLRNVRLEQREPVVASTAVTVRTTTYIARARDNVRTVGDATGVGGNTIIRANGLVPPYTLHFGQSLLVPGGRYHRVAVGETGIAIAHAYGIPWSRIVDANGLTGPFALRVGQRLVLPDTGRGASATRSMEARAAAFQVSIDDLLTGAEPARVTAWTPRTPAIVPPATGPAPRAFAWPASGRVVASFGSQGRGRINQGIDVATAPGMDVRATARGEVAYVGTGVPGFGGLILVRHDGGWISAYGRVDGAVVAKGTRVVAGQTIARVSGDSLHFELRRARIAVDPQRYLLQR